MPKEDDTTKTKVRHDDVAMTFPQKLMEVLNDEENSDCVAWLPDGKGFLIFNRKKFSSQVMPKYFKQAKFTSFTRKLNRWGFERVTARGPEMGAYYHPHFLRDDPAKCVRMTCDSGKTKQQRRQTAPAMMLPSLQDPSSMAMMPPSLSQLYPGLMGMSQNSLLQQQLLLRMEQERAMSSMYLQMLQNKELAANQMPTSSAAASVPTMMNPGGGMLNQNLASGMLNQPFQQSYLECNVAAVPAKATAPSADTTAKPAAKETTDGATSDVAEV